MDPLNRYLFGIELNARCLSCSGTAYWIDFLIHRRQPVNPRCPFCPLCETEDVVYLFEERYYRRWLP